MFELHSAPVQIWFSEALPVICYNFSKPTDLSTPWASVIFTQSLNFLLGTKSKVFNFLLFSSRKNAPWMEDSESGLKVQFGKHWKHSGQKRSKTLKMSEFAWFCKMPEKVGNCQNAWFCQFSPAFWPKRDTNVIRFEFWDQIWNRLFKAHLLEPKIKGNWKLYFLDPIEIWKRADAHGVEPVNS